MKKLLSKIMGSSIITGSLTLLSYLFYAVVLGVSLFPSLYLVAFVAQNPDFDGRGASLLVLALSCGVAFFLFMAWGIIVIGIVIRLLSAGIKPGSYPITSLTMVRWLLYSGLYNLAGHLILTLIPMSFLQLLFFRIVGAKIGKNVQINTWFLNDAYLLEIGDNVLIGGKTDVSCHTFERGHLVLSRIKIGSNTAIGQRCYISPGVTIGERSVIGQYAFIRKNTEIPPKTIISAIAGLPIRTVAKIEKSGAPEPDAGKRE